jgi:outer membrane protein OmpA-like peptidoglycan-associated protein
MTNMRFALMLSILLPCVARAERDQPGAKDYPLIQRFPKTYLSFERDRDWDRVDFLDGKTKVQVEGRTIRLNYGMEKSPERPPSAIEFTRNYTNALTQAGWSIRNNEYRDWLVARLEKDGREVWARISYNESNGAADFYIVEKQPMPVLIVAGKPQAHPSARPDKPGKDYDGIPRLPAQHLNNLDERRFDAVDFPLSDNTRRRVEGRKLHFFYDMDDKAPRPALLHATKSYRQVLTGESWVVMTADEHASFVVAVLRDKDKETWAQLSYNDSNGSLDVIVVERGEMKQVVSASSLLDQLKREGRVAFEVHFDTGLDVIKAESKPVVAQMIDMLKADAAIKVEVAGHTDNVGNEKDNQSLSERRAKSVMAALVAGGIEAARLSARGWGQSRPVADNGTEGGRALNRRVELVKK